MEYFTADWHLGDDRIGIDGKPNLFYRPFKSVAEQDHLIIEKFMLSFNDGDTLWHLGDVFYEINKRTEGWLNLLREAYPHSEFNLVIGNYDEDKLDILKKYFDNVYSECKYWSFSDDFNVYLNHYPIKCKDIFCPDDPYNDVFSFALTGHIHGLWKVQQNIINVGVDAWHFKPVSKKEILFCYNAMKKHYDENVFLYKK